jgi:prepilin-type processing-associated H-X9-DG protein
MALTMYISDFSAYPPSFYIEYITTSRNGESVGAIPLSWGAEIEPYATGAGVNPFSDPLLACPSDRSPYGYNESGVSPSSDSGSLGLGGSGQAVVLDGLLTKPGYALRETQVVVPSDMIAVGDLGARDANGMVLPILDRIGFVTNGMATSANKEAEQSGYDFTKKRHGSKANMLFCDGHVEGPKFTSVYRNQDVQLQRWNNDHQPHRDLVPKVDLQP